MADHRPCDVSLVCTVRNEVTTIDDLLRSIAAQTMRPREVIVVDGGSRDGTQLHVEWWHGRLGCPLRLIVAPGANIASGRNRGIAAARFPLIAVTDAGVTLDPAWLERLTRPFADATVDVVAGFFVPDPRSVFEGAMGATALPTRAEIDPERFLPSSRSIAFRTRAWEIAGGYPEWLDYGEDLVFDLALRRHGLASVFAGDAIAHFRPRGNLLAFWHQYFRYARGDGKAGLWAGRHALRYCTYLALITLVASGKRGRWFWPVALVAALRYVRRPYLRLRPTLQAMRPAERVEAIALVPLIRAVGDAAKMAGYPVGLLWRLRHYGVGWSWRDTGLSPAPSRPPTWGGEMIPAPSSREGVRR